MTRSSERLIDAFVLAMLLVFAYLLRDQQPALSGVIVMAALKFWMDKNATEPTVRDKIAEAAAKAAAEALLRNERRAEAKAHEAQPVEIVGQSDAVDVDVVDKTQ